ncbi:MAG: bifunctional phosphoribosylaminoimidazolecarboxamide formyltransferase/IMP cyclohydrolase, partial [Actinomycetota bacterium]
MQNKKISRALISVSDKTGIVELAAELIRRDIEIISSDGTAALLRDSGIKVRTVTEVTGSPEILGGKVKTLHPAIHGALLADQSDPAQVAELEALAPIDLLVINLYPVSGFDIGGPALTRAAAKNCAHVSVITNPLQYADLINSLDTG